jgi:hypothetical protein
MITPWETVMHAVFKNPKTGELKKVKIGWSWTLFFFSALFGLPLFLRKLYIWGAVLLVLWVVNLLGPSIVGEDDGIAVNVLLSFILLGLQIWLGIKGNEMTAKNYLEHGWRFAEPQSDITKFACRKWGIFVDETPP